MFGLIAIMNGVTAEIAKAKARQEWLDSLPPEQAAAIREEDRRIARENEEHRRKLEIAEAGRARNFWGK